MTDSLHAFANILDYRFADIATLKLALTHPSAGKTANNQRLEFLGDAVLGLVVADMLYHHFPKASEGELARRQAALVCASKLVEIATTLKLGAAMILSASEAASGGRETGSNLEDALEATIGALYLDGGLEVARNFVEKHWAPHMHSEGLAPKDAKTALQEWAQGRSLPLPVYTVTENIGPAHAPLFTVEASVQNYGSANASASSKRSAEQAAAKILLSKLDTAH